MSGSTFLSLIVNFLALMILSRVLTPIQVGDAALVIVATTFFANIAKAGISEALVYSPTLDQVSVNNLRLRLIAWGTLCSSLLYLSSSFVISFFDDGNQSLSALFLIAVPIPFFMAINEIPLGIMQKNSMFKQISLKNFTGYLISQFFVAIPFAYSEFGAKSIILAQLSIVITSFIFFQFTALPNHPERGPISSLGQVFTFGVKNSISNIITTLTYNIDNLVIVRILGPISLGFYTRAFQVLTLPTKLFGMTLSKVIYPEFTRLLDHKPHLAFLKLKKAFLIVSLIGIPLSFLIYLISFGIVELILGEKWMTAAPILQTLCMAISFRIILKISDSFLKGGGKMKSLILLQIIYFLLVFIFVVIGSNWGLIGSAYGVVCAIAITALISTIICFKGYMYELYGLLSAVILQLLISIATALTVSNILPNTVESKNIYQILFSILSCSTLYMIIFISLYFACVKLFAKYLPSYNIVNHFKPDLTTT